eukprot:705172-Alexandrium_andersonii.AAC.1
MDPHRLAGGRWFQRAGTRAARHCESGRAANKAGRAANKVSHRALARRFASSIPATRQLGHASLTSLVTIYPEQTS